MRGLAFVVACAALAVTLVAQNAPPPKGPFKTVHLLNLKSEAEVAAMQRSIADQNAVVSKLGVRETKYRLYKVSGPQAGSFGYLMESSWSGADAYDKVHSSADWAAVTKKHAELDAVMKEQIYNRYVEVSSK